MLERGITDTTLKDLVDNADVMFIQRGGEGLLYQGEKGSVALIKQEDYWIYKTAYLKADYNENTDIIRGIVNEKLRE